MPTKISRTLVGGVAAVALGGSGLAVLAPAQADTGAQTYACTSTPTGAFNATVQIDSTPDKIVAGGKLAFTTKVNIPDAVRDALRAAPYNARELQGTAALSVNGTGSTQTVAHTIPRGNIFPAAPLNLTATGELALSQSGDYTLTAGSLAPSIQLYDAGGAPIGLPVAITCTAPAIVPVIDTVSVTATSTTKVELNSTRVKFGQDVQAKAEVATTGGAAKGNVVFTLGDRTETVAVGANGKAQTTLRSDVPPGSKYPVTATFVPTDTKNVTQSEGTEDVKVVKDKANVQVRVGNTQRGRKVKAKISINSVHGEKVEGKVKVILKDGDKNLRVKTKKLRDEDRTVGLIRLYEPGKYKVRVKFLGSSEIRKTSDKAFFEVRR